MSSRVLFVTGSDAKQFSLAADCITSIHQQAAHLAYDIAFLDLGCTGEQVAELQAKGCMVKAVDWEFGIQNSLPQIECRKGQICRPFLPSYFPDHDIFFWIDADAWVQHRSGVDLLLQGAAKSGAGLVPEIERSSKFYHGGLTAYLQSMATLYQRIYADAPPAGFSHYTNINAGVFCFHRDSHLWHVWKRSLHATLQAFLSRNPSDHEIAAVFGLIDQVALNTGIRQHGLERAVEYLPLTCNWTCHLSLPAYDDASNLLVEPYLPHAFLGIVHLTNPWGGAMAALPHSHERRSRRQHDVRVGKDCYRSCRLETTTGGHVVGSLFYAGKASFSRYESVVSRSVDKQKAGEPLAASPQYDYVSPGLETIWPDAAFPHMIEGNPDDCQWPYLRRGSPHRWCVDRRFPAIGFVSRDEAALLYSTALRCRGRRGLEIGCWQGWSACHIAAAGVCLDIIDPVLGNPTFRPTIEASFRHAGVIDNLTLHAAPSPEAIAPLAAANAEPWSFFFIDGDHEGDAVLNDTIACVVYAAEDCIILFHDLASPDVAKGLRWLQGNGWHTRIYHTSQIMAAAWRGDLSPPDHTHDEYMMKVLGFPEHLNGFGQ